MKEFTKTRLEAVGIVIAISTSLASLWLSLDARESQQESSRAASAANVYLQSSGPEMVLQNRSVYPIRLIIPDTGQIRLERVFGDLPSCFELDVTHFAKQALDFDFSVYFTDVNGQKWRRALGSPAQPVDFQPLGEAVVGDPHPEPIEGCSPIP